MNGAFYEQGLFCVIIGIDLEFSLKYSIGVTTYNTKVGGGVPLPPYANYLFH